MHRLRSRVHPVSESDPMKQAKRTGTLKPVRFGEERSARNASAPVNLVAFCLQPARCHPMALAIWTASASFFSA